MTGLIPARCERVTKTTKRFLISGLIIASLGILSTGTFAGEYKAKCGRTPIPAKGEFIGKPFAARRLMPLESERVPAPKPGQVIPWYKAPLHVGRTVTVEGYVERATNIGNLTFINFSDVRSHFCIVAFKDMYDFAPNGDPANYNNKTIQVTGRITMYRGKPQIEVRGKDQIKQVKTHKTPLPLGFTMPNIMPPPTIRMPGEAPNQIVPWNQAKNHIGKEITIQGKVILTKDIGNLTFLNFTTDWDDAFHIAVMKDAYPAVPNEDPATAYDNKTLQVTGNIIDFNGRPQMPVYTVAQIKIIADRKVSKNKSQTNSKNITWQQAKNHIGKTVTVQAKVISAKDIGSRTFINFSTQWKGNFCLMIPKRAYRSFPGKNPAKYLNGKSIQATGKITQFKGTPQMEIKNSSQIVLD